MENKSPLRGMATVSYWADDLKAARDWYTSLLGIEPYFERPTKEEPAYIEYRIGDYLHEFGIIDKKYQPKGAATAPGGTVLYWHVDNVEEIFEKMLSLGATVYEPIVKREAGFITASVLDPFGNIIGLQYNPHYLEILKG